MARNIKLEKSLIGRKKDQIATANSLGLKKVGDGVSVQPENEATPRQDPENFSPRRGCGKAHKITSKEVHIA